MMDKPHFVIKANLQKSKQTGVYFSDQVTADILKDVCYRITGVDDYTCLYVDNEYEDNYLKASYNHGRMAILHYRGEVNYISFSEKDINARNASVQSAPTAFGMYYTNPHPNKKLFYYFLNIGGGNLETNYLLFMYRLMCTVGFVFLNQEQALTQRVYPFTSIEDIMFSRTVNSGKNQSNNSSYLTKSASNAIDIYGKTYGANKYETSMICYAISCLAREKQRITLYEVLEQDMKELPAPSLEIIRSMGKIQVVPTGIQLEKRAFEENNSLRSPRYIYNLLGRIGKKRCAMCDCEIAEIIQGAHVWPVSSIKRAPGMPFEKQLWHATNGNNGVWLCENHHKLFDQNLIIVNENGDVHYKDKIDKSYWSYMDYITTCKTLPEYIMSDEFVEYIRLRNFAV